jgi:hypothetical protein
VGAFVQETLTAFCLLGAHSGTSISIGIDNQAGIACLPGGRDLELKQGRAYTPNPPRGNGHFYLETLKSRITHPDN